MQNGQKLEDENAGEATYGIFQEESHEKSEVNTDVNLSSLSNITENTVGTDNSNIIISEPIDVRSEVNADVNLSSLSHIAENSVVIDRSNIVNDSSDAKSRVNSDVNLSSLSNITETSVALGNATIDNDSIDNSNVCNEDIDSSDIGNDTVDNSSAGLDSTTADGMSTGTSLGPSGLIPENLILVETSKGLVLSALPDGINGLGYGSISTSMDEQGRQLITPTLPVALFSQIQSVGIVDGQEGGLFGTSPDCITVSTATTIFEDSSTNLVSNAGVPVELIPSSISVDGSIQEIVTETIQPVTPEKRKKGGGWPKGKKRKLVPDVQAPKKPATGYVLFAVKRRQEIKVTNPDLTFSDVTKMLGYEWTNLPQETKEAPASDFRKLGKSLENYLLLAEKDKARYIQEMKQFQNSEHYQNYLKKKKSENGDEVDSLIDLEDHEGLDELYCRICNQHFISVHNKKEHMFGRQHLQAITSQIQKDIQSKAEEQKQQVILAASLTNTDNALLVNGEASKKNIDHSPVDVDSFIHEYMKKNQERDNEIKQLLKSQKCFQEDFDAMTKQVKELQELEGKLEQDIGSLKAYGSSLEAQIDTLKMVPTLFGVINF